MKTYENESMFVNNFAKDCKQGIKENGQFEAVVNGITVIVTGMDNNNSSKVTVYSCTVNGVEFTGSITALKKKLNITYTKEYKRSAEATTRVTIKTDNELSETAKRAADRIKNAWEVFYNATQKYGLSRTDLFERQENVESLILETLKRQRDKVAKEREAEEKRKQAVEAQREAAKKMLLKKLTEASAKGDMKEVMRISQELKKYM